MTNLSQALRVSTQPQHERLHEVIDMDSMFGDRQRYAQWLLTYLRVVAPIETRLKEILTTSNITDPDVAAWQDRIVKTDWLSQDLAALQFDVGSKVKDWDQTSMPAENDPIVVDSEFIGSAYVLEGMMLGGMQICKTLHQRLGIGRDDGGRFFAGYGSDTMTRWRSFKTWADDQTANESIATRFARAAFDRFRCSFAAVDTP